MTLKAFFRHGAGFIAVCWLSTSAAAHVVNLGTLDFPPTHRESEAESPTLSARQSEIYFPAGGVGSEKALASIALPWARRASYSFADVMPAIERPLQLEGDTVITLYHDVMNIASVSTTEAWLGVLVVLCLILVQLRRTQRLLHHRPLAR